MRRQVTLIPPPSSLQREHNQPPIASLSAFSCAASSSALSLYTFISTMLNPSLPVSVFSHAHERVEWPDYSLSLSLLCVVRSQQLSVADFSRSVSHSIRIHVGQAPCVRLSYHYTADLSLSSTSTLDNQVSANLCRLQRAKSSDVLNNRAIINSIGTQSHRCLSLKPSSSRTNFSSLRRIRTLEAFIAGESMCPNDMLWQSMVLPEMSLSKL
ncbi:hypothetical protein KP509_1Z211800 [Ceratopteris richardii]|nr:hypothetical protein KP509_1Z211800 [Ceratopteris richardii]